MWKIIRRIVEAVTQVGRQSALRRKPWGPNDAWWPEQDPCCWHGSTLCLPFSITDRVPAQKHVVRLIRIPQSVETPKFSGKHCSTVFPGGPMVPNLQPQKEVTRDKNNRDYKNKDWRLAQNSSTSRCVTDDQNFPIGTFGLEKGWVRSGWVSQVKSEQKKPCLKPLIPTLL